MVTFRRCVVTGSVADPDHLPDPASTGGGGCGRSGHAAAALRCLHPPPTGSTAGSGLTSRVFLWPIHRRATWSGTPPVEIREHGISSWTDTPGWSGRSHVDTALPTPTPPTCSRRRGYGSSSISAGCVTQSNSRGGWRPRPGTRAFVSSGWAGGNDQTTTSLPAASPTAGAIRGPSRRCSLMRSARRSQLPTPGCRSDARLSSDWSSPSLACLMQTSHKPSASRSAALARLAADASNNYAGCSTSQPLPGEGGG
jgi:hypothetical protein